MLKYNEPYSLPKRNFIQQVIGPIQNKAEKMKDKHSKEFINNWYANELLKLLNNQNYINMSIQRVVL